MLSIFSFPNVIANYSFHLKWDSSKVHHQRHTFSIVIFEILKIDYRSLILPFGIATNDGYRWEDYQALLTAKWERMGSHISEFDRDESRDNEVNGYMEKKARNAIVQ